MSCREVMSMSFYAPYRGGHKLIKSYMTFHLMGLSDYQL